jgi:hypothetical protein
MRKKLFLPLLLVFLLASSAAAATFTGSGSTPENAQPNVQAFSRETRTSSYTAENRPIAPYQDTQTSPQQVTPSDDPFVETMLSFNLTYKTEILIFELPVGEGFLAIDGASQSFALHVDYTVIAPQGQIYQNSTLANNIGHFFFENPANGTWQIIATLVDIGETTAWVQAFSEHYGTKYVTAIEKEQLHLVAGQNKYYLIPLASVDWFYMYANTFQGAGVYRVELDVRRSSSYGAIYKFYTNYTSQLWLPNATTPVGDYLLQVTNFGSTDIFIEIVKPVGISTQLSVNQGIQVYPQFRIDLEFFRINLPATYDWVSFDGALSTSSGSTRYLIINPNPGIIFDDASVAQTDFVSYMLPSYVPGTYYVGVFTNQFANGTIKVTSSNAVPDTGFTKIDQMVGFTQSGQSYYLKIPQSQAYFMFAGFSYGPSQSVAYSLLSPSMSTLWRNQSTGTYSIFPPSKSVSQFLLLRVQGLGGVSALIHTRFQGMEDYSIQSPDSSNYTSRFPGDLILSNVVVRNSNYLTQHIGNMNGSAFVGFYDTALATKTSVNFTTPRQDYYQKWRGGYENPSQGNWLQVYLDIGALSGNLSVTEVNTLQSGDESLAFDTPLQLNQTNSYPNSWNVESYRVHVDSSNWFGIVNQMLSLNATYPYHPYMSLWVYDSNFTELDKNQVLNSTHLFDTNFWPNARTGDWTIIVAGYQDSLIRDPLNCTISFVGNLDFTRDWPADLTGSVTSFSVTVAQQTSRIDVLSGSSISNFTFNPVNRRIIFDTFGSPGTDGFCMVTIPLQVAPRPFEVSVDSQPAAEVLSQQNDTCTFIYVPFEEPNHRISLLSSVYAQATPTPQPTQTPTPTPSHTPTPSPSPSTSISPSTSPTQSNSPSTSPSNSPTSTPSTNPSSTPTTNSSNSPSTEPTTSPAIPEMSTVIAITALAAATLAALVLRKTSGYSAKERAK